MKNSKPLSQVFTVMAAKLIILPTLQLLLFLFVVQFVQPMPPATAVETNPDETVVIIYSTGQNEIRVKNGSNVYRIPTPGDMKRIAYDPKHGELYLTFRRGTTEETETIYRTKLSDNKAENVVSVFANASPQEADENPRYGPDCLDYDDVDEKIYFCDHRGVFSCDRDSGNCTIVHDLFGKAGHACQFALNSAKGTLYLSKSQGDTFPTIHKGSKDGTGEFVAVIEEVSHFTVDQDSGLLFYIVTRDPGNHTKPSPGFSHPVLLAYDIMKADLDGKNRQLVRTLELEGFPTTGSPQVAGDRIYWGEFRGGKFPVLSCNKFSGQDLREHQLDGQGLDKPLGFANMLVLSTRKSPLAE